MKKRIFKIFIGIGIIYLGIYLIKTTSVINYKDGVIRMFFPNEHYAGKMVGVYLTPKEGDSVSYRILEFFKLTFYKVKEFDDLLLVDVNNSILSGNIGWTDYYEGLFTYLNKIPRHRIVVRKFKVSPNTFVLVLPQNINPRVIRTIRVLGYILIFLGIYLIYDQTLRKVVRI